MLTLLPSTTSEDSTTQFSILPGRQSRMSYANVIQVRLEVTNFEMFLKVDVKDEKKKLGECKAEFQPKTARRLRFSCDSTKHGKLVSFFSIQPTFRQCLYTKESIKKLNTIAEVAYNVSYTNYRDERIEN